MHKAEAPCNVVFTMRKLRTVLPSLKPAVDKELRGSVVYQLKCSRCQACYVGQTDRHFCTRLKEHQSRKSQPVYRHFEQCGTKLELENTEFLAATTRNVVFLETLEALWIEELKPRINTKEEYKQRSLTIRLSSGFWPPHMLVWNCLWLWYTELNNWFSYILDKFDNDENIEKLHYKWLLYLVGSLTYWFYRDLYPRS